MIDEHLLQRLGGIATTHQLRAAGASSPELTAAVADGRLHRLRKGIYVAPSAPPLAVAAVTARGRLSCVSAARTYGLWSGTDTRLHLQHPPNARAGPAVAAVRHWLPTEHDEQLWRVTFADCLRSVARCADRETAIAVFDTAISAGLTTPLAIPRILERQPARVTSLAALARPGSESGVESLVRQRLHALGHLVEQQVHVAGVGRVDMRVDGVLFLEIDGFAFHSDRQSFERDRARDAVLARQGSARLRVSAAQVMEDWPTVLASIRSLLRPAALP
ncbi:type IV toxin-antitoxin system AbiEi family antitoxin domain-containing protein [Leifsonia shinshuensis]|uniref:type IV toxin-antitoxin system AbiEi family antitoxin domain-containing protein n=1 Tax=Leifsonia shinshuensis TaxID=150026 RepID=UPI002859916B|nr:type IV toxin-antitoxin system AbiEi family antitoxin domain-containing protein [Leifsonia shinshuensis]MDR6969888.1 very-short-patch-repair endonuclease [Leifsonia shinshuensis]